MKINNAQELYNFLKTYGLINLSAETAAMSRCIEEFGRMCACDPAAAKNAKLSQCRNLYVNFVNRSSPHKNTLLSKINDSIISFCIDGQVIIHLTR